MLCTIQGWKKIYDLMLGLNETMHQFATTNSFPWYCHVLRREDGHVLRWTFDFEVEGHKRKGKLKKT